MRCLLSIFPSIELALGNYSLPLVSFICLNWTVHHVGLYQLVVNCALFELFRFLPVYNICVFPVYCFVLSSLLFSYLVLCSDANDVCEPLETSVDKHSLPKIANSLCEHLDTSVDVRS